MLVHVCVFAFVVFDRDHRNPQKEVVIEFAPSNLIQPEPVVEKVVDITGIEHAEPERA